VDDSLFEYVGFPNAVEDYRGYRAGNDWKLDDGQVVRDESSVAELTFLVRSGHCLYSFYLDVGTRPHVVQRETRTL